MKKQGLMAQTVLLIALVFLGLSDEIFAATYDFLSVGAPSGQTTLMTSPNGRGHIKVTTAFSPNGAGPYNNLHSSLNNSKFLGLFPSSAPAQGHLTSTLYGASVTVTYDLSSYTLGSDTVFGLWNMTDEVDPPYRLEIRDVNGALISPPFGWNSRGNDENTLLTSTTSVMKLDPPTGNFLNPSKSGGKGGHSNAQFWDNIPANAKTIILYGNLGSIPGNTEGDGVGSYFAELHRDAKEFKFECGMAVVTCSSASLQNGWSPCGNGPSDLSPNAYVVAILDTRDPIGTGAPLGSAGLGWGVSSWHNDTSATDAWNARNLGEVFGITLDDSSPANIYVTATSIYFGSGRGPGGDGGVYRLSGTTYGISLFHSFSDVGSVSLGNICFDREHNQFFVTDLDHGLIRRLNATGAEVTSGGAPYNHGITGRNNVPLPVIADVSSTPGGLTQSGRRVFGVQVFRSRLYYSVWYAPGTSGPLGYNEVWSTGLLANGDLITTGPTGPRMEFALTGLAPFSQYSSSEPVITDIAFSQDGRMLVGERSICTGNLADLSSGSHAARAVEYTYSAGWVQSQVLNVGLNVGSGGRINSAGGVDFDCEGHEFVTGDALINSNLSFPYAGNAVYGLQIYPAPGNIVDTSWVIDFDGSDSIYDKLSVGSVEVNRCCDCISISDEHLECLAPNTFNWSFCVTNTGTLVNGHLVFLDLPPGVTINPSVINITPGLAPGQGLCTNVTVTLAAGQTVADLCFRIAVHTPDYSDCCVVAKCLKIPECCAVISHEDVKCDPTTPTLTWCFSLQNLSGVPVKYIYVIPQSPTCVSIPQNVITLPTPLAPGASTSLCVPITVTNSPCDKACFRIALHDVNLVNCCAFDHCVRLRCGGDNQPPTVDCGPSVLLCDPKLGQGYIHQVVVQDPDGDLLTVVWKLDGTPVKTVTVPAGVSLSPTPVKLTANLSPGFHILTACVSDGNGAPAICDVTIEVGDHTPPKIACPPDQRITGWEYQLGNLAGGVQVSDNCTPNSQIKITQEPGAGVVLSAGHNCIKFTATDLAGNTSTCMTYIDVNPVQLNVGGTTPSILGISTAVAPADLLLSVEGVISQTDTVEYFSNGLSLGKGAGANAKLKWSAVPAGSYSVLGVATKKGTPSATFETSPLWIIILPAAQPVRVSAFKSVTFGNGKIVLSIQAIEGERCAIDVTGDLKSGPWRTVEQMVGDGQTHTLQVDSGDAAKFFRIRIE